VLRRTNEPKKAWTKAARKALVELYLDGMDIDLLASHFNKTQHEIVFKLSEILLGVANPKQDSSAKKYRKPWTWAEKSKLWRLYAVRNPIHLIAEKLGRDELGVCFKLLSEQIVILPRRVVEKYDLDQDDFAVESESDYKVPVCSNCLDVVMYCKCKF
jgi:uncharacterized iron-regulated protein